MRKIAAIAILAAPFAAGYIALAAYYDDWAGLALTFAAAFAIAAVMIGAGIAAAELWTRK